MPLRKRRPYPAGTWGFPVTLLNFFVLVLRLPHPSILYPWQLLHAQRRLPSGQREDSWAPGSPASGGNHLPFVCWTTTGGFPLLNFDVLWRLSHCNQSPRWFPQETRPVVKLTIFLGTILQTWCPCSWLLHPCPSISSLVQTAHFWGLFACELINILFLFYPVPSLHLFPARVICSKSSSYHFTFKYFSRHLWITHNHNFIVIPNNKINISVPSCLKNIFF